MALFIDNSEQQIHTTQIQCSAIRHALTQYNDNTSVSEMRGMVSIELMNSS